MVANQWLHPGITWPTTLGDTAYRRWRSISVRPPRHDSEQETICRDLESEESGYFAARVLEATVGTLYRFRLDGDPQAYPDPASRFQPQGPHGPSAVIDPTSFEWPDSGWKGIGVKG